MWLLAAGRKVCGAVGWLWMCVVGLCRALTGRAAKQATSKPNNVCLQGCRRLLPRTYLPAYYPCIMRDVILIT